MSQEELKNTLLGTIDAIKKNPNSGKVVFRAETQLVDGVSCTAKVRDFPELLVDEPASLGGKDQAMNPVELIAAALGTCQEIMYGAYASVMGIQLDDVKVNVKGYLDLKGLFGMDENVPAGYSDIQYHTAISSPEAKEKIQQLVETVESHCPVLDTLTRPIAVSGTVSHNQTQIRGQAVA